MDFIEKIKLKAKQNKKTIVLPETMDNRILIAAKIILEEEIANIILIGNEEEIINKDNYLKKAIIIDPEKSTLTEEYINRLTELRKDKGITKDLATKLLLEDYMYYACMLVLDSKADGIVSGACHSSSDTLRPALQLIKTAANTKLVSSFFLMDIPNCNYGNNGLFIFADCGLNQNPNAEELAYIAYNSAKTYQELVDDTPYVAMLSHSTKGSANHPDIDKVVNATKIAKGKYSEYKIDGEFQLDTAIIPEIARLKGVTSEVIGHVNVLIFPNLDSGNIGYKLVEKFAHAKAYGPLTQGMAKPVNDLSRGCSIEDIIGVVAITAVQAQKRIQNRNNML